jgi:hypothetical protein
MMKHLMIAVKSCAALAVVAFCLAAQADTIKETASLTNGLTDVDVTFSIPQFDPSLGTLTSVEFDLDSSFKSTLTAQATSLNQRITQAFVDPTVLLSAPDHSTLISDALGWINFVGSGPSGTGSLAIPLVPPGPVYASSQTLANSDSLVLSTGLSPYIGLGNANLPFSATVPNATLSVHGSNNTITMETVATVGLTVTYRYAAGAIPEPGTLALLAAAAVGIVVCVRRRRS